MRLIIFFICIITSVCYSQTKIVVDSLTKEPIPYVGIKYNSTGFYTESNGTFTLPNEVFDSIEIFHLSYNTKTLKKIENDTIFLTPKTTFLEEIVISNKKDTITIKPSPSKKTKDFSSFPISPSSYLLTFLTPKDKEKKFTLEKIKLPFDKAFGDKLDKTIVGIIRINIFEIQDNANLNCVYTSEPIKIQRGKWFLVEHKLPEENQVTINKKGIVIGFEIIGFEKDSKLLDDNQKLYLRPSMTGVENEYFKSETYIKYFFDNKAEMVDIDHYLNLDKNSTKKHHRTTNLGLTLFEY
ncbi:hypothetical protein [Flavobacterium sp.]|uniref:hypothetical protein n=1 Tax=Flavobacterium sp. TaxID=239 RepID=UPI003528BE30